MVGPEWSGALRITRGGRVLTDIGPAPGDATISRPHSSGTRFQAASISKRVLAVVVLALVEQGELHLHRPVADVLPHLPEAWRRMTLHHLLTHTSGLGHWDDVPGLDMDAPATAAQILATLGGQPTPTAGAAWRYSGPGYLLAAEVAQRASGRTYAELVRDLVLTVAGMPQTTTGIFPLAAEATDGTHDPPDVARGRSDGRPVHIAPGLTLLPGTGDLWSTTADLIVFGESLAAARLLGEESMRLLVTPHARVPAAAEDGGFVLAEAYGYGVFLGRIGGRRAAFHPGDNPGYCSLLAHLPDEDVHVALLTDDERPGIDAILRATLPDLERVAQTAG